MPDTHERVEILIRQDLDVTHRAELVGRLEHQDGISSAYFEGDNHHRMIVDFDRHYFSHLTLLDIIKEYGYDGKIVGDT